MAARLINAGSTLLAFGETGIQSSTSPCSCSSSRTVRPLTVLLPRLAPLAGTSSRQGRTGFRSSTGAHFLSSANKVDAFQFRDRTIPRSSGSSSSNGSTEDQKSSEETKTPFGYTRKDVLLIGLGVTLLGVGLKSGLEFVGVDPLQAGNVIQLVLVLGLTVVWIGTYIFRVSNKDMTYAQQLRDYEKKVMEKRLDSLTEAELQVLVEQVEEEKRRLASGQQGE